MTSQKFVIGNIVDNKYKIIKKIGLDNTDSSIFKAELINKPGEFKVLKILHKDNDVSDEFWNKFCDESVTASRVSSKINLIQTHDIIYDDNHQWLCIVLEYFDSISLRKFIDDNGSMHIDFAIDIFFEILLGVKELHDFKHQIIHRDLKPENILISKDMLNVKIIDFGISTVINKVNDSISSSQKKYMTHEATFYGTYPYICPDIYDIHLNKNNSTKTIGVQFDFFSLGVIFYEMLIGDKPFYSDDYESSDVIKLPLKYDMKNISSIMPTIPASLENIIFRCLASKQEDQVYRYNSIDEIIKDLEKVKEGVSVRSTLIKPTSKRIYQCHDTFNILNVKEKRPFYFQWWFFNIILCGFIVISIIMPILFLEIF